MSSLSLNIFSGLAETNTTRSLGDNAAEPRNASRLQLQPASNLSDPQAGRLSLHFTNWTKVTCNNFILQIVQFGLKIQFFQTPPFLHLKSSPFPPSRVAAISKEVSSLLVKSAIAPITPSPEQFISPIFDVAKKDSEDCRVILNLKILNTFIRKTKFRLEGYQVIFSMIQVGDFMVSIDLKDAFLMLSMHPSFHKYLCFEWLNVRYCY